MDIMKGRSVELTQKSSKMSSKRSSVPIKFTDHDNKMTRLEMFLSKLPDDLGSKIARKSYLEKTILKKDMNKKDYDNVVLDKEYSNLTMKKIIKIFELDYFNFKLDNESIIIDITSTFEDEEAFTHIYSYKKIKLDQDKTDKFEIVLVKLPIRIHNTNQEYIRSIYTEAEVTQIAFMNPDFQMMERMIKSSITNRYHLKDEYNTQIIKKLKYKDLINIFNSDIENYDKVVKRLNNLSLFS